MNILFYFPTNQRSVSLETLMEAFSKKGHRVWLLGWGEKGDIHKEVEEFGVETHTHQPPAFLPSTLTYIWYAIRLRNFIAKHQIELVYSHTQPVNFVSVLAQHLVKTRFIICRHHSDYIMKGANKNAKRFDRAINRLGKEFIVPSQKVYDQITAVEGVAEEKVRLINYAYKFSHYPIPDMEHVEKIRQKYSATLLLCTVSRFIPCKRYDVLIQCTAELIESGKDIKLMILGSGPLEADLKNQVKELKMEDRIFFIGFTTQVLDYMQASDMVVHFSDSEASNSVIKEAGLLEKPVAVCRDVGDFDDYIEHEVSGFKLSKLDPCKDFTEVASKVYDSPDAYKLLGAHLKEAVLKNFSAENVIPRYTEVMTKKNKGEYSV